jgi:hypothetical protein
MQHAPVNDPARHRSHQFNGEHWEYFGPVLTA